MGWRLVTVVVALLPENSVDGAKVEDGRGGLPLSSP
jgi:hypothetical protein